MSAKDAFQRTYEREHGVTRKLLHAFPAGHPDFRPHERSNTALKLAWTFVMEEQLMLMAIRHELKLGGGMPPAPESWDKVLQAFDDVHAKMIATLNDTKDFEGTVTFYVGPKQTGDFTVADFLWFMLHDQIHHRGQLSVYIRMAGGKVPSIYGPSADEPWS